MTSFNLITEPWIQVTTLDRATDTVSLRELFRRAPELASITGDIAPQEVAITRLLLAILYRAAGKKVTAKLWQRWWEDGLPHDDINAYLDVWADRFDLIDPVAPFYQVAGITDAKGDTENHLSKLVQDVGTNGGVFTQRQPGGMPGNVTFAEAARWLLFTQSFDPQGIASAHGGGRAYGSQVGWCGHIGPVMLTGGNLAKTLLLNLAAQHPDTDWDDDLPAWERPVKTPVRLAKNTHEVQPGGTSHLYTWHPRQIRLIHDGDTVTNVRVAGDADLRSKVNLHRHEPMTAWRRSTAFEKFLKISLAYAPRRHDAETAMWRNMSAYLPTIGHQQSDGIEAVIVPGVVTWLHRLKDEGRIPGDEVVRLQSTGVIYGPNDSVFAASYTDSIPMPLAILQADHVQLAARVEDAVRVTERAVGLLRVLEEDLAVACRVKPLGNRDFSPAETDGFALVDGPFRNWFAGLTESTDPDAAYRAWGATLSRMVRKAGEDLVEAAGPRAWTGTEAMNSSEKPVNSSIASLRFTGSLGKLLRTVVQPDQADDHTLQVLAG